MARFILMVLIVASSACSPNTEPSPPAHLERAQRLDIGARYEASGFMGDDRITIDPVWRDNPHSAPTSFKISYSPGPNGFGGVYWMNRPRNWCRQPGEDLSAAGYTSLTFWARGELGDEIIEFKAGGISCEGQQYKDSFEVTTGRVPLTDNWQMFTLDLRGQDLSSVIGGFCWVAAAAYNPNGVTFYVDDIFYEE